MKQSMWQAMIGGHMELMHQGQRTRMAHCNPSKRATDVQRKIGSVVFVVLCVGMITLRL